MLEIKVNSSRQAGTDERRSNQQGQSQPTKLALGGVKREIANVGKRKGNVAAVRM
jgi:hypothetical protein